jgi:hypothetical protein
MVSACIGVGVKNNVKRNSVIFIFISMNYSINSEFQCAAIGALAE